MSTEKQIEANRINSRSSSGPKTNAGKEASSKNALKHGLLSSKGVLECESESSFDEMSNHLKNELNPVGIVEEELVKQVISALWRLRRIRLIETGIFEWEMCEILSQRAKEISHEYVESAFEDVGIGRIIKNKAAYTSAQNTSQSERMKQFAPLPLLGKAFMQSDGVDSFTKLARYESALQRMLYRSLDMLKKLQAERLTPSTNGSNENGFVS